MHVGNVLNNARAAVRWRHGSKNHVVPEVTITAQCPKHITDLDVLNQVSLYSLLRLSFFSNLSLLLTSRKLASSHAVL